MKKYGKHILFLLLWPGTAFAQDRLGLVTSRYSGLNAVFINPSLGIISPYQFDLNLATGSLAIDNNFISVPKKFLREHFIDLVVWMDPVQARILDQKHNGLYGDLYMKFPSLGLRFENYYVGAFYNKRINITMNDFPSHLLKDYLRGFDPSLLGRDTSLARMNSTFLLWDEAGGSFSTTFYQFENDRINIGLNLKYLFSAQGYYVRTTRDLAYSYTDSSQITIDAFEGEVGMMNEEYGQGMAFDFGLNWVKQEKGKSFEPVKTPGKKLDKNYLFHAGISLVDMGFIRFRDGQVYDVNAYNLNIKTLDKDTLTLDDIEFGIDDLFYYIDSAGTNGGTTGIHSSSSLDMRLPSALSLQFDYHLGKNFYLNSTFTFGFPARGAAAARRPSQLSVTPRYQTRDFEFFVPVCFYNYNQFRVGAALRIKGVEIGTDRIYSYTKNIGGLKGLDFYVSVKISIEEIEKSFLKPPQKQKKQREWEYGGYTNKTAYRPNEFVQLYYSSHPDSGSMLVLQNFGGDTLDTLYYTVMMQKPQPYKPWKYGYGFKLAKKYKVPKEMKSDVYFIENRIPVVVKPVQNEAVDILVVIPTNTYEANNPSGGKSIYSSRKEKRKPANVVSFMRPIPDAFFKALAPLNGFLKEHPEWKVGYITDKELDNSTALKQARVVIIAGNSSHWTRKARQNFDKYIAKGGNVILLSGSYDFMKYQVRYKSDGKQLVCYKQRWKDPNPNRLDRTGEWADSKLEYPMPRYTATYYPALRDSLLPRLILPGLDTGIAVTSFAGTNVMKQMMNEKGEEPAVYGIVYKQPFNYGKPIYVYRENAVSGFVINYAGDAVLKLDTVTEKEALELFLNFLLKP
ncbi:MAG: N,N-dimethylformamidase beta subunit family domain-containing protein [Bacteroidota bacterium]